MLGFHTFGLSIPLLKSSFIENEGQFILLIVRYTGFPEQIVIILSGAIPVELALT
jgi:hypothetical protein